MEIVNHCCNWLQTRLEEYLTLADTLPIDLVESTEKAREKDRRQVTREEKILQQKEEHVSMPGSGNSGIVPSLPPLKTPCYSTHSPHARLVIVHPCTLSFAKRLWHKLPLLLLVRHLLIGSHQAL